LKMPEQTRGMPSISKKKKGKEKMCGRKKNQCRYLTGRGKYGRDQ